MKPVRDKTEAVTKIQAPKIMEELTSFPGSIQHLSKGINKFSKKTDRMRRLIKKGVNWEWAPEINEDFEKVKKEITEALCLASFDSKEDHFITTDACNSDLGQYVGEKLARFLDP